MSEAAEDQGWRREPLAGTDEAGNLSYAPEDIGWCTGNPRNPTQEEIRQWQNEFDARSALNALTDEEKERGRLGIEKARELLAAKRDRGRH